MATHAQLRELFFQACDLSPQMQRELIDRCCADDTVLRSQLERLLHLDATTEGILAESSLTEGIELHLKELECNVPMPDRIGKYRIKQRIGEGGMGIVYLAQQARPERDVALKVIRPGVMSQELFRRFEFEVTVLARLQHPGIAKIYEAGLDENRQPFFAMEFIEGELLNDYVRQRGLNNDAILNLFQKICSAVDHAHVRGVIHRDLKPANIMVRSDGQPVVLDFGVARATSPDAQRVTQLSKPGQLVGTLPYMSPERISGKDLADTRSDVYSLGVIIYELLCGKLPHQIQDKELLNAARTIEENNPQDLAFHGRQFRGDLNTIVMKALEPNPDQRYASVTALSDDLGRFQNHQPVLACPPSRLYKIRKFARRNKTLVTGVIACLAILIIGTIGTTVGMFRAQHETNRLTAVNEFISRILVSPDPSIANANVKFARVLKDAAREAPERFADYPELEADVSLLIGRGFVRLAMIEDAIPLFRRSYDLRSEVLGPRDQLTREAGLELVTAMLTRDAQGVIELATQLLDQLPADQLNGDFALRLRSNIAFAHSRLGNRKYAEQQLREILLVAPSSTQKQVDFVRETRVALAGTLRLKVTRNESTEPETDRLEAIDLYRTAIDQSIQLHGEDHSTTLFTMLNLIDCLEDGGELMKAEQLALRVIELAPQRHSPEHELSIRPLKDMTFIRYQQERYDQAADFQIKAVELTRQRDGDRGVSLIVMMVDALPVIEAAGRFKVGEDYARFLLKQLRGGHYEKLSVEHQLFLARFLSGQGRHKEAESYFEQVLETGEIESRSNLKCLYNLFMGEHRLALGDREQAEKMLQTARNLCLTARTNSSPRPKRISDALARAK